MITEGSPYPLSKKVYFQITKEKSYLLKNGVSETGENQETLRKLPEF